MKTINLNGIVLSISLVITTIVASYSQNEKNDKDKNSSKKADTAHINNVGHPVQNIYYTCPSHPKVRADKPGNCAQCGLTMNKKIEKVIYVCPLHTEVKHDEKGQCEKCGAVLEKKD